MRLLGIVFLLTAGSLLWTADAMEIREDLCDSISTQDLLMCTSARLSEADARLNEIYREKLDSAGERRAALRDVQRAWLTFRDEHCDQLHEESRGGSEASIEMAQCLANLTEGRATELAQLGNEPDDTLLFRVLRALERSGYNGEAVLDALASAPGDKWTQYAEKHCEFLEGMRDTTKTECLARLALDRSY